MNKNIIQGRQKLVSQLALAYKSYEQRITILSSDPFTTSPTYPFASHNLFEFGLGRVPDVENPKRTTTKIEN